MFQVFEPREFRNLEHLMFQCSVFFSIPGLIEAEPLTIVKRLRTQSAVRHKQRSFERNPKVRLKNQRRVTTNTDRNHFSAPRRQFLTADGVRGGGAYLQRSLQSVPLTSSCPRVPDTFLNARAARRLYP